MKYLGIFVAIVGILISVRAIAVCKTEAVCLPSSGEPKFKCECPCPPREIPTPEEAKMCDCPACRQDEFQCDCSCPPRPGAIVDMKRRCPKCDA